MKCLHCRQRNFAWARRCDHCGAPIPQAAVPRAPNVRTEVTADLARLRYCDCFENDDPAAWTEPKFHPAVQDTQSEGWKQLLELVEIAAGDGREEFAPFYEMTPEARSQVITLPPTIAKLKAVRRLLLVSSFLVRIPPEIGDMENLVEFTPYMSYRLHWFPYEITRCARLDESSVSTRALYGNHKFRPPFPRLATPRLSTAGPGLGKVPSGTGGA